MIFFKFYLYANVQEIKLVEYSILTEQFMSFQILRKFMTIIFVGRESDDKNRRKLELALI